MVIFRKAGLAMYILLINKSHGANEVMGNEKTEKAYSSIVSFLLINSNYSRVSLSHVANVEQFYEPHGHVISGDLSLVQNPILRDLMMKGTKYREPRFVKLDDLNQTISSSIDNFLKKICSKHGLQLMNFSDWKTKVEQVLSSRLSFLSSHKPWLFEETKLR